MLKPKTLFFLLTFFGCFLYSYYNKLIAQQLVDSPYSRFGIGNITDKNFAQANAMGGASIALRNDTLLPLFINVANPASYSGLAITTFEAGLKTSFNSFKSTSAASRSTNSSLNYLAFGFPIRQKMGACFGIMPLSNVGYSVSHTSTVSNIGEVKENYEGNGGANQLFIGLAYKPFSSAFTKFKNSDEYKKVLSLSKFQQKNFLKRWLSSISIGANAYYYFGTINTMSRVIYPDVANTFNTKLTRQVQLNDFGASFGLQNTFTFAYKKTALMDTSLTSPDFGKKIKKELKEKLEVSMGYTYSMSNTVRATYSEFANTFIYYGSVLNETIRDTILYNMDQAGSITLPDMHGVGFVFRKGNKLMVSIDAEKQFWTRFRYFSAPNQLTDMTRFAVGIEFVPDKFSRSKGDYLKRIHYRLGTRYNNGYLNIRDSRVNEIAITTGVGLPVGANKNYNILNLSVEIGQTGNATKDLIKYNYIKATVGFTFNDRWFLKYKYD